MNWQAVVSHCFVASLTVSQHTGKPITNVIVQLCARVIIHVCAGLKKCWGSCLTPTYELHASACNGRSNLSPAPTSRYAAPASSMTQPPRVNNVIERNSWQRAALSYAALRRPDSLPSLKNWMVWRNWSDCAVNSSEVAANSSEDAALVCDTLSS